MEELRELEADDDSQVQGYKTDVPALQSGKESKFALPLPFCSI